MSETKQNIVDGDVAVLDLEELEQAMGGASLAGAARPAVIRRDITVEVDQLAKGFNSPSTNFRGGSVLIENDGWQGNVFNVSPILIENDGWQ
jgi:hypothetical protein